MEKAFKKQQKFQKVTKNQSILDTVLYCKSTGAGGCWFLQKFYTKLFQKMPFAFIWHSLFPKISFLHQKTAPQAKLD